MATREEILEEIRKLDVAIARLQSDLCSPTIDATTRNTTMNLIASMIGLLTVEKKRLLVLEQQGSATTSCFYDFTSCFSLPHNARIGHVFVLNWRTLEQGRIEFSRERPTLGQFKEEIRIAFQIWITETVILLYLPIGVLFTDKSKSVKIEDDETLKRILDVILSRPLGEPAQGVLYAFSSGTGNSPETSAGHKASNIGDSRFTVAQDDALSDASGRLSNSSGRSGHGSMNVNNQVNTVLQQPNIRLCTIS